MRMARLWLSVLLTVAIGAIAVAWVIARPAPAKGYSGLEFAQMTDAAAHRAPLLTTRGALVARVADDSPAAKAGIERGAVISAIDGVPIVSAHQASDIVRNHHAGDRVIFTLFDEPKGGIGPRNVAVAFEASAPANPKIFLVEPGRTLAKELFNPPTMAANAAWSHRLAHGPSIRPRALVLLRAGRCTGFAPEEWQERDAAPNLIHLQSKDGSLHAIYKLVPLRPADAQHPKGYVLGLVHAIFHSPVMAAPTQTSPLGVASFNFGNRAGVAGLALWRLHGSVLSVWIAGVPAGEIAWALPLTTASLVSLHCESAETPPEPRDPSLRPTAVSVNCLNGRCEDSDFAATILERFRLGYVHDRNGQVYLVNPVRDFWLDGQDGPGVYRQIGGENEKLEPGRTN